MRKIAVIIGAGPAGLTCAYDLLKRTDDIYPIIVEASQSVGGLAKSIPYKKNRIDVGGHCFFSEDNNITDMIDSLLSTQSKPSKDDIILKREKYFAFGGPDPEKVDKVMLLRNRVTRIYAMEKFFDYPINLSFKTRLGLGFSLGMKAKFSYYHSHLKKLEESNLENFYINKFGKTIYELFFKEYLKKLWGADAKELNSEAGLEEIRNRVLIKVIKNTYDNRFKYPKYGPGQFYDLMAQNIRVLGGEIILDSKVVKVNLNSYNNVTSIEVVNKLGEKRIINCDYLVSSMPIKDLVTAIGFDVVPQKTYYNATQLTYRDYMSVCLTIDKFNIKNKTNIKTINGILPDTTIFVNDPRVQLSKIQIYNNFSPYIVEDFENKVFLGLEYFATEGDENWESIDEEFKNKAIEELITLGFIEKKENVLDSILLRVKKAYPSYSGTYEHFDEIKEYLNSISNLYCIGRNGQHKYSNMERSMLTAIACNDAILDPNIDKEHVWNVSNVRRK